MVLINSDIIIEKRMNPYNIIWSWVMDEDRVISKDIRYNNKYLLYVIFIPALIIVLIVSVVSFHQVNQLIRANRWVEHTYKVMQTADKILYNVTNAESHQRGYLVTGDNQFIADLDSIKTTIKQEFDNLAYLIQDNPSQEDRVARFMELTNQRMQILVQTIQLKMSNKLNTQEGMNLFQQGENSSNQVKDLAHEIKSIESVLLNERNIWAVNSTRFTNLIIIVGNIISLGGLVLAFVLSNKELTRSLKEEKNRKNAELQLRSILAGASDMIAAVDNEYRYITFNEAYQREFKRLFNKSLTIGMKMDDALSEAPSSKSKLINSWKESLRGGEFVRNMEFEINKEQNTYEITSSLIKNEDNEITGAVHIVRNISKQIQEQLELKEFNEKLNAGMQALQDRNDQINLLVEMSDIMLACNSLNELSEVMTKYCQRMLNFASGYLYIMHPSKNYLEVATTWGSPNAQNKIFSPDQCWAIRLGRLHHVGTTHNKLICPHIKTTVQEESTFLCVPLMAQNDIYGLLYLELVGEIPMSFSENQRLLITAFSELTALAFANIRLRENLRYQSMRDPLTGLYNRRYLEDFLTKQIHQAEQSKTPLTLLMLDLDHFKKINDNYGHDAGDAALKEVTKLLQNDIRVGDLAARYGGEEFVIVFYNADLETVKNRAETIRYEVSMLQMKYGAQAVGPISISIGIAIYSEDGHTASELIESADKALYFAKSHGKNQIILYSDIKGKI
jgi:diguanylate cyclase (GGDEF)-like protein